MPSSSGSERAYRARRRGDRDAVPLGQPRLRHLHAGPRARAPPRVSPTPGAARRGARARRRLRQWLLPSPAARVRRSRCHGIDLMEDRIAAGRERYPTLELQVGSATELPFADGQFDLVTQFTCLSSILDDDVRLEVARRCGASPPAVGFSPGTCAASPAGRPDGHRRAAIEQELRRLFGEPALLRRAALAFELTQLVRGHAILTAVLAALPPLRSHFLGLWRLPPSVGQRFGGHAARRPLRPVPAPGRRRLCDDGTLSDIAAGQHGRVRPDPGPRADSRRLPSGIDVARGRSPTSAWVRIVAPIETVASSSTRASRRDRVPPAARYALVADREIR